MATGAGRGGKVFQSSPIGFDQRHRLFWMSRVTAQRRLVVDAQAVEQVDRHRREREDRLQRETPARRIARIRHLAEYLVQ